MALTKVKGQVINDSTGLVVGVTTVGGGLSATNGFFSGIVTAVGDASFSGNVSVGGTLTYEDVTNIDAVGLVTAQNGIVVGSGITLSKDGDIFATGITTISENLKVGTGITISPDGDAFFTGVCPATSFSGDGSNLTGLSGVSVANQADNRVITNTGTTDALNAEANLTFSGDKLIISNHGTSNLRSLSVLAPATQIQFGTANDVGGFLMSSNNGQFGLSGGAYFSGSGWVATHTGSTQIRTDGDGDISFCSNTSLTSGNAFTPSEKVTFNSDGDVTIADGDLVIGTAGHGIDFSAQTASSDGGVTVGSEVLDHYEEGTWTPVLRHYHSGSFQAPSGSAGTVNGYYTRIGNVCYINATFSAFSYTNLTNSSYAQISELPFAASSSTNHISVIHTTGTAFTSGSGSDVVFITSGSNTYLNSKTNNSNWDWAVIDGGSKYLYISGFYFV